MSIDNSGISVWLFTLSTGTQLNSDFQTLPQGETGSPSLLTLLPDQLREQQNLF